jgi:ribosome biogenesis GTPase
MDRFFQLGFTRKTLEEAGRFPDLYPGRVISQYKDLYRVALEEGELLAEVTGKLRYQAEEAWEFPAVGDFVLLDRQSDNQGNGIIHGILKRKSLFQRKAAGGGEGQQVVAVNMDIVFLCMSLNKDFNLRRLERYLALAWESGAAPVILLTKADLCQDLEERLAEIQSVAFGVQVIVTSSLLDEGIEEIRELIKPGVTAVFLGSSGVGKSTLINHLLGKEWIKVGDIREDDDKGRHTTTRRDLMLIPEGGAVIDTPGMREIGLESGDLSSAFQDIEDLALDCRFRDCTHESEPGCQVRRAIEEGTLSEERLASYKKLQKENRYDGLNSRQIEKEKISTMFAEFGGIKNARDFVKNSKKRR